jgi:hypothetical protein
VIKFVSDLWQVGGFALSTAVSSINKTDRHDIAEILLKVALDTITLTHKRIKSISLTCSTLLRHRSEVKNMMDKMKSKKIPHCRNSCKIPHCRNNCKIPHCRNSCKIPHCRNSCKIPHCRNNCKIPHCRNSCKIQEKNHRKRQNRYP